MHPSVLEGFFVLSEGGCSPAVYPVSLASPYFCLHGGDAFLRPASGLTIIPKHIIMDLERKGIGYRLKLHIILPALYFGTMTIAWIIRHL